MEDIKKVQQKTSWRKRWVTSVLRIFFSAIRLCFVWYSVYNFFWYYPQRAFVISLSITIIFVLLMVFLIKLPKTSKLKKRIKCFFIVLSCMVIFIFLWFPLKQYWMDKNCKCMCSSSSGRKVCDCLEYMCYEKGMRNRLQKCKNRCKIKIWNSYNSCISTCEREFEKDWIWLN